MLQLETKIRDEIVRALQSLLVPTPAGAVLMQVSNILSNLKPVEAPKTDEKESV